MGYLDDHYKQLTLDVFYKTWIPPKKKDLEKIGVNTDYVCKKYGNYINYLSFVGILNRFHEFKPIILFDYNKQEVVGAYTIPMVSKILNMSSRKLISENLNRKAVHVLEDWDHMFFIFDLWGFELFCRLNWNYKLYTRIMWYEYNILVYLNIREETEKPKNYPEPEFFDDFPTHSQWSKDKRKLVSIKYSASKKYIRKIKNIPPKFWAYLPNEKGEYDTNELIPDEFQQEYLYETKL